MSGQSLEEILHFLAKSKPHNLTVAEWTATHTAQFVSDYCVDLLTSVKGFEVALLDACDELTENRWHSSLQPNAKILSEYLRELMPTIEQAEKLTEEKPLLMKPGVFRSRLNLRLEILNKQLRSMSPLGLLVHEHFLKLHSAAVLDKPRGARVKNSNDSFWAYAEHLSSLAALRDSLLKEWRIEKLENYLERYRLFSEEAGFEEWLLRAYRGDDSILAKLQDLKDTFEVQVLWQKATTHR